MNQEVPPAQGPVDVTVRLRNSCYGGPGCKCTLNEAANEIERLRLMLQISYCQKTGADTPHGLDRCDNYLDWLKTLTPNAE